MQRNRIPQIGRRTTKNCEKKKCQEIEFLKSEEELLEHRMFKDTEMNKQRINANKETVKRDKGMLRGGQMKRKLIEGEGKGFQWNGKKRRSTMIPPLTIRNSVVLVCFVFFVTLQIKLLN